MNAWVKIESIIYFKDKKMVCEEIYSSFWSYLYLITCQNIILGYGSADLFKIPFEIAQGKSAGLVVKYFKSK